MKKPASVRAYVGNVLQTRRYGERRMSEQPIGKSPLCTSPSVAGRLG